MGEGQILKKWVRQYGGFHKWGVRNPVLTITEIKDWAKMS